MTLSSVTTSMTLLASPWLSTLSLALGLLVTLPVPVTGTLSEPQSGILSAPQSVRWAQPPWMALSVLESGTLSVRQSLSESCRAGLC
jgi:hypothetical protein